MEHIYEDIVMGYVTSGGKRFVCPQFLVHGEDEREKKWHSNPDFVAIDILEKAIYVIEVTTSSNAINLADKLIERAEIIERILRDNLGNDPIDFRAWPVKFRAFVREAQLAAFKKKLNASKLNGLDIVPITLESILANWTWYDRAGGSVNSLDGS